MKPPPSVSVDRHILATFRREALKAYPKEHIASLWGRVRGKTVRILALGPLKYRATEGSVSISAEEVEEDQTAARAEKMRSLGTIHTHTDTSCPRCGCRDAADCSPSETDWVNLHESPEVLMGICTVKKNRKRKSTRIRFFLALNPLKVRVRR